MIRQYSIQLRGVQPLLMHRDNIEWSDYMEKWRAEPKNKQQSKAGDDRSPAFRWLGSVYHDDDVLGIPQENIARCLMEGGALVPTGKGQKTFKAQTQSGMRVDEALVPLEIHGDAISWPAVRKLEGEDSFTEHMAAVKGLGFSLSVKRAKVGQSKHIRVRPVFQGWSLKFGLTVWDEALTTEVLRTIFQYAGQYKGLGDWRPGGKTPGPYGMFQLEELEQVQ